MVAIVIFAWAIWAGSIAYMGGYDAGTHGEPPIGKVIQADFNK